MTGEGKASTSKAVPKIKPSNFCVQLHSLLENPRDPEALRWVDGEVDQFQITVDEQRGLNALRPNLDFKSMSSFVRQLSYYDFKRLSDRRKSNERRGEARVVVFTHHSGLFTRGNPANVEKMKRKLRIRAERGRRASAVSTGSVDEDHSASGSPLFSPVGNSWPGSDQPPPLPLPSPSFAPSFNSGMGSFSLSAPPPPRSVTTCSTTNETHQQSRWQPYNPPEASLNYSPSNIPQTSSTYEAPRYSPYPRGAVSTEHRASVVSLASDSSNLSPRSKSAELAYHSGTPARPSPTTLGPADYSGGVGTSFSDPFATRPFPSPSTQPSQYFPSSRHPASPGSITLPHGPVPTGLPVAYDQSPSQSIPPPPSDSSYPTLSSSLSQYRSNLPTNFHFSNQQPQEQQYPDTSSLPYPIPHLGFRNHHRFSSAPSPQQPAYPYSQFTPPRTDEYPSPTTVPDEDLNRRAALEARRTSYPFPHPPAPAPLPPSANVTLPSSYSHPQTVALSADSPKPYFPTPPLDPPLQANTVQASDSNPQWHEVSDPRYPHVSDNTRMAASVPNQDFVTQQHQAYYDAYASGGGGFYQQNQNTQHHHTHE
ncbi:hypothetical protein JCM5350_002059 [Sporobolomyces pararoseus]